MATNRFYKISHSETLCENLKKNGFKELPSATNGNETNQNIILNPSTKVFWVNCTNALIHCESLAYLTGKPIIETTIKKIEKWFN